MQRFLYVVAVLSLLAGLAAWTSAGWAAWQTAAFVRHARVATGTVLEPVAGSTPPTGYRPRVRFTDASRTFFVSAPVEASGSSLHPGDTVEVFYDPADPNRARIAHFSDLWSYPVFMGFFGAIMLAIGGLLWRSARRGPRPDAPYGPDLG